LRRSVEKVSNVSECINVNDDETMYRYSKDIDTDPGINTVRRQESSESKLWSGTFGSIAKHESIAGPIGLHVLMFGVGQGAPKIFAAGERQAAFIPFRGEPEIPRSRELLEFMKGKGEQSLFVQCS
jgi:hypothetical protein